MTTRRITAATAFVNGPASDIRACTLGGNIPVRRYTAPPGSPMPPNAMNSTGRPIESIGWLYLSGLSVR